VVLSLPLERQAEYRLLAAARLAGDEIGGAREEVLLRGFVGRGGGEELERLEVVRLHLGVMRGGSATTGEEEDREEQEQLRGERRQVADDASAAGADLARGGIVDELVAAFDENDRQDDREGEEHPAHQAVALGGAAEDFVSGGRRGAGHDGARLSDLPPLAILQWVGSGPRHDIAPYPVPE